MFFTRHMFPCQSKLLTTDSSDVHSSWAVRLWAMRHTVASHGCLLAALHHAKAFPGSQTNSLVSSLTCTGSWTVRPFATCHTVASQGYLLSSQRQKLKPEWQGRPGAEIKAAKLAGEVRLPSGGGCGQLWDVRGTLVQTSGEHCVRSGGAQLSWTAVSCVSACVVTLAASRRWQSLLVRCHLPPLAGRFPKMCLMALHGLLSHRIVTGAAQSEVRAARSAGWVQLHGTLSLKLARHGFSHVQWSLAAVRW